MTEQEPNMTGTAATESGLTREQVTVARARWEAGELPAGLAAEHGVTPRSMFIDLHVMVQDETGEPPHCCSACGKHAPPEVTDDEIAAGQVYAWPRLMPVADGIWLVCGWRCLIESAANTFAFERRIDAMTAGAADHDPQPAADLLEQVAADVRAHPCPDW